VYENPFNNNGSASNRFMEPIVVEVSYDASSLVRFNPAYSSGTYSTNPANWLRFAGLSPVLYNLDNNSLNAGSLFTSGGGDAFDLSNLVTGTSAGANCLSVASNAGCTAGTVSTLQGAGAGQGVRYIRTHRSERVHKSECRQCCISSGLRRLWRRPGYRRRDWTLPGQFVRIT
jgi:hypothetical protein